MAGLKRRKPTFIRLAVVGALAGMLGLALIYLLINKKYEWIPKPLVERARQPDLLENPAAKRCGECHETIFKAWQQSRHARAWVSETYIKDSENRSKEKCLPCHIPREVRAGRKPEPRLKLREEGIYCVPCHVARGKINGPYALYSPPHPTDKSDGHRKSVFCVPCHEKTYKEWRATGHDDTCQKCHMPRAAGRLVQNPILKYFHAPKDVADHRFPHGEIGPREIALRVDFTPGRVRVVLLNDRVPHFIPTADNGDPRLYLTVLQFDGAGERLDKTREILAPQQETALPYKKEVAFQYPLEKGARRLSVLVEYKPAWSQEKTEVLRESYDINF